MLQCPACQRENRQGARFCAGCGGALLRSCPACGHGLPEAAAFCDACGAALEAEAPRRDPAASRSDPRAYTPRHLVDRILTSRGALEGERKHVTVLFADVAGFTALSESRDPEDIHALMDRFFQLVLDEVHRYEGTVNQFLGDGVMALFGAPVALEDAPQRAVHSALAIQRGLGALAEGAGGVALPLRIGIHSGPVVVGRIGDDLRMDYTAVGDTTNLAARLQQIADPGEIWISEATRRLVDGFFEVEDAGRHAARGKSEPVQAFRVTGERRGSGRIDARVAAGLTPLAGRQRELEALAAALREAREEHGQVAFLVGDAGIGKSRLIFEFRQQLARQPHAWFEGRCSSYGATTAFQPLVDGLQRFFAIDDRDPDAGALAKLAAGVAAWGEDLGWTEPYLRKLLSLPAGDAAVEEMDPLTRRSETIRALHALFLRVAEEKPLVFAIEDLHWIDPASEQFLEFWIDAIPTARVLLLLTHRPGYRHPFGDRSYHVRVPVQALSAQEMAAMAEALLESRTLPAELRALIAKKAEGNPFFVEEVTRSLLEEGALRVADGRAELSGALDEISVPDSIHDVLMARIDRLDEEPKRAIQVASVIGREFALRLLERIVEAGEAMHGVVGELRALELIYQKAAHPELAFMFKHALTHDVAYESVLLQRRRSLHRIVGHAIEELYAERLMEHFEALAHHFAQAEEWGRALLYHERAADKARDAYANQSAAAHYREALRMAEKLGDEVPDEHRCRIAEGLGHTTYCLNEFRASGDAYAQAARWCSEDEPRALDLARAAYSYFWGHHYAEADRAVDESIAVADRCGSRAAAAIALATRANRQTTEHGIAGLEEPEAPRSRVARLALESGNDEAIAQALTLDGLWAEMRGDYRLAMETSRQALESAHRTGLPQLVVIPRWVIGLALTCLGEYGRGMAAIHEALAVCDRVGDRALKSRFLNTLGWCFSEFGAHRRASGFNREGAELAGELVELGLVAGAPEMLNNASINLAGNQIALGNVDGAFELLEPLRVEIEQPGDPWQRWRYGMHLQDALARAHLARGEPERALGLLDQELAAARRQRSQKIEARALELRGRAFLYLDRREEAGQELTEALSVARRIGYPPAIWRSLSLLAELARRRGDEAGASRLAHDTRKLMSKLAATLPETELRRDFASLGEQLARDPLGAYR